MAAISDPWNDVIHKVGVDPVDDACIHIGHLEQGRHFPVPGAAIDPDHVSHPLVLPVFNDHGHARMDT